jgi:3-demethoxyubiquinol 3-hydroxylase
MSLLDPLIIGFDKGLRTLFAPARATRPSPAAALPETQMLPEQQRLAGRLIRVDHTGEVCAQGLYQGQALTARSRRVQSALQKAADEEMDHLAWCEERLQALGANKSLLNPMWYASSLLLGAASGLLGDRWNLAFLAETERQVEGHLKRHLERLPPEDQKSRAVVEQMKLDEAGHAVTAENEGAAELPEALKRTMRLGSKLVTGSAYWI